MPRIDGGGGGSPSVGGHRINRLENPPFHPKGYINVPGYWGKLKHGRMVESSQIVWYTGEAKTSPYLSGTDQPFRLRFLFNPSELAVQYTIDPTANNALLPPAQNPTPDMPAIGANIGSLGFSLFFDRTYELYDRSYANTADYAHGVEVDLNILKKMLNIEGDLGFGVQKPPQYRFFYFFFGGYEAPAYYAAVTGINFTYAHFTQNMVPIRAQVDISTQLATTSGGDESQFTLSTGGIYSYKNWMDPTTPGAAAYDPYNSDALASQKY